MKKKNGDVINWYLLKELKIKTKFLLFLLINKFSKITSRYGIIKKEMKIKLIYEMKKLINYFFKK
jgi:hypothetical protein